MWWTTMPGGKLLAVYSSDDRTSARNAKICNLHSAVLGAAALYVDSAAGGK